MSLESRLALDAPTLFQVFLLYTTCHESMYAPYSVIILTSHLSLRWRVQQGNTNSAASVWRGILEQWKACFYPTICQQHSAMHWANILVSYSLFVRNERFLALSEQNPRLQRKLISVIGQKSRIVSHSHHVKLTIIIVMLSFFNIISAASFQIWYCVHIALHAFRLYHFRDKSNSAVISISFKFSLWDRKSVV